ncbi:hypothetical protein [Lacrimispora sp.]|uniref:hypothetical protein n=1 Tax=Lacrimispora sp. TaxID=2719234 RepID=UPI0028A9700D|nr:hypothetical protein [Lacrimispora sp.]
MQLENSNIAELMYILRTNNIAIYGAGYVAARFYQALKEHGLSGSVFSFVTTSCISSEMEGVPIVTIDDLKFENQTVICVAVHESIKDEIISNLVNKGFTNYIWIYPYLYILMLGLPINKNIKVPLYKIWNAVRDDYSMAIRYLAIDNYYAKNTNGYELYKRYFSIFNSNKTSEKRLMQFIGLIKSWDDKGYDINKCSAVLEDYKIFDGAHRIAVASYFNQGFVMCDIYPLKKSITDIHNQAAVFTKQSAIDAGFEPEFIALLDATNRRIEEQYK